MSRADFDAELSAALDGFAVPELSGGFADRVVDATDARQRVVRDRRGLWTHVRRGTIGMLAIGALSAGAVASGLLGAAGIRVPVLTAMLAPNSVVEHKSAVHRTAHHSPRAVPQRAMPAEPVPQVVLADSGSIAPPLLPPARLERQARRQAFLEMHPGFAAAVHAGPEARRAFLANHPGIARTVRREHRVEHRQFLATHPIVLAAMREQVAKRREARAAGLPVPPIDRAALRERVRELRAERQVQPAPLAPAAGPARADMPIARPFDPEHAALREQRIARRAANFERRQQWRAMRRQHFEGFGRPPR